MAKNWSNRYQLAVRRLEQGHKVKTHPSDVVFFYDNPYSLSRTYVNCDLKSYASGTISKAKTYTPAIESLAKSIALRRKEPGMAETLYP